MPFYLTERINNYHRPHPREPLGFKIRHNRFKVTRPFPKPPGQLEQLARVALEKFDIALVLEHGRERKFGQYIDDIRQLRPQVRSRHENDSFGVVENKPVVVSLIVRLDHSRLEYDATEAMTDEDNRALRPGLNRLRHESEQGITSKKTLVTKVKMLTSSGLSILRLSISSKFPATVSTFIIPVLNQTRPTS